MNCARNEVSIYDQLKAIQGIYIPRLLFKVEMFPFYMIALSYIDGDVLTAEAYSPSIANTVTLCLREIHKRGVMHQDVRPENIIVDKKGWPWLLDFGYSTYDPKLCPEEADKAENVKWYL